MGNINPRIKLICFFTVTLLTTNVRCQNLDSLDHFIQQKMNASGIVGLGAAIIVNKKLVWMNGYGFADKDNNVPFTTSTIMNIGSISKTFTGASLMRLVEQGKVSLDEDINVYLPFEVINPFFPEEKITLRNLATHTSSIIDRSAVYNKVYHYGGDSPETLGEFLKNYLDKEGKNYAKKNFLKTKPGSLRTYSNIGASLAGYIVELTTGEGLNEYSKREIFDPLGMSNTGWFFSEIAIENHSKLYENKKGTIKPIELYGLTTYPDGGVRTSTSDLSKFFTSLLNGGAYDDIRILKQETAEEMLRFQFTESNKPENINLEEPNKNSGIFWATKRNVTLIGHAGSDPGVRTEMFADLSKEIAVIVLVNTYASPVSIFNELWKHATSLRDAEK